MPLACHVPLVRLALHLKQIRYLSRTLNVRIHFVDPIDSQHALRWPVWPQLSRDGDSVLPHSDRSLTRVEQLRRQCPTSSKGFTRDGGGSPFKRPRNGRLSSASGGSIVASTLEENFPDMHGDPGLGLSCLSCWLNSVFLSLELNILSALLRTASKQGTRPCSRVIRVLVSIIDSSRRRPNQDPSRRGGREELARGR